MNERRVVISGLGLVTPIGIGADAVWSGLLEKRNGVRRIAAFDPSGFRSQVAGQIETLKTSDCVPKTYRKSIKVMARDIEIAVVAAYEAVKDAGLVTKCLIERGEAQGPPNIDSTRLGANIGAGVICADLVELAGALATAADENNNFSIRKWGSEGMNNLTPLWLLKFLPNMLSCHVTIVHDAQAPSNTITCAEASSHLAIGEAFRIIARGAADICFCGGAESRLNPMAVVTQDLLGRLSRTHNDTPAQACRPFDAARDGTVVSEGGGLMILEELEHARARGARIYCEVIGFGAGINTVTWREPDPDGQGITAAIRMALRDAKVSADRLNLIGTYGSGVPAYDIAEARGIRGAIGDLAGKIPAFSTKAAMGNNGAGSGAIDAAVAAMCLKHNTIPPAQNLERMDPECGLNVVSGDPVDARIDTVLSVGYALNGSQTAALVLKRLEA